MTIRTVVVAALLGVGAYFARPYLPDWAAEPITSVLRSMNIE
jgi:hypothetical protein